MWPELLTSHMEGILRFTLKTMPNNSDDFEQFLDVVVLEADPIHLIDVGLKICEETSRLLPFDELVLKVFRNSNESVLLPFNVLSHLLNWLLYGQRNDELLGILCQTEFAAIQRFGCESSEQVRMVLLPFMRRVKQEQSAISVEIPEDLVQGYPSVNLFKSFLLFVSGLSIKALRGCEASIEELCVRKFYDPGLLVFLKDEWIDSKLISGLSRCIWNCPGQLLEGSEVYLPGLYRVFKGSIGVVRLRLAKLFVAIEKKTGISVLDCSEVCAPHRSCLREMMSQFRVL